MTAITSHQCFISVYKIFNNMLSKLTIIYIVVYMSTGPGFAVIFSVFFFFYLLHYRHFFHYLHIHL